MGYFYDTYMAQRRAQWLRSIVYVEAQVGNNWHRGDINPEKGSTAHAGDHGDFFPTLDSTACTYHRFEDH